MNIRLATLNDLDRIMEIFEIAKRIMRENHNLLQWNNGYPSREVIINDIDNNNFYVIEDNNRIVGQFAFIIGEDITYNYIDGKWLNNKKYGTIHRIASSNEVKNIFKEALDYCLNNDEIYSLRVDTHKDNLIMQHVLEKNGFTKCGIIYLLNGDPRIAYEKKSNE